MDEKEVWDFDYLKSKMEKREEFSKVIEDGIIKTFLERCKNYPYGENGIKLRKELGPY